jgi:rhodanese-related sulfurtransferase
MQTTVQTIDADGLRGMIEKFEDFALVEVLREEHYRKGHIPGAMQIPVEDLKERAEQELPDKGRHVVVYCGSRSCPKSREAARILQEMGYAHVTDFEDGKQGWEDAGYMLERRAVP